MEAMYHDGIVAALAVAVLALVLPALWFAWWFVADLGEGVSGSDRFRPRAV